MVVFLFLGGCNSMNFGGGSSQSVPQSIDFREGYGGLVIEALEGLPPKEIYEGSNFKIGLRLKNTGAYDIKRGAIGIVGFDEKYVVLSEWKKELNPIEGESVTNSEGGFYIEEFDGNILKSLDKAKEYSANYFVSASYDYRSEISSEVCINTNLYGDLRLTEESCKPQPSVNLNGQGAPVAITKIEEVIIPEGQGAKIIFKLHVKNKGKGTLGSVVYLDEVKLANRRLSCEQRFLDLKKEGDHVFVCTAYESSSAAYTTPFYAAIYYTYQIKAEKSFKIKTITV